MPALVWAMLVAGAVTLVAGVLLAVPRMRSAKPPSVLALGQVFAAVALAMFAAEHFFDARDLMAIVPKWMPLGRMFWTEFVGVALVAAALSFIADRYTRWSGLLLAVLFLTIVAVVDVPRIPKGLHNRIFWVLFFRETCFAAGALVLAGSKWPWGPVARGMVFAGRWVVGLVMVFYGVEHFLYPHNVVGVPLEKITPAYISGTGGWAFAVGAVLVLTGMGLLVRRWAAQSAAVAGTVLAVVVFRFYAAILLNQLHGDALEGLNYFGDTLLFAGTVLMAGLGSDRVAE